MDKTENLTIRLDAALKERLGDHPEINWSHVIRQHLRAVLDDLDRLDSLASGSRLTAEDVHELAAEVDAAAARRLEEGRRSASIDGDGG